MLREALSGQKVESWKIGHSKSHWKAKFQIQQGYGFLTHYQQRLKCYSFPQILCKFNFREIVDLLTLETGDVSINLQNES